MPISCACDMGDDYEWFYQHNHDFHPLESDRRARCYACQELIDIGADCGVIVRHRAPRDDIEERIHGDEVPLANKYLCEECYGLMLSVEEAGGCVTLEPGEPIKEAVAEWRDIYPQGCEPPNTGASE